MKRIFLAVGIVAVIALLFVSNYIKQNIDELAGKTGGFVDSTRRNAPKIYSKELTSFYYSFQSIGRLSGSGVRPFIPIAHSALIAKKRELAASAPDTANGTTRRSTSSSLCLFPLSMICTGLSMNIGLY